MCFSLGCSNSQSNIGRKTLGQYGAGLKAGVMRIGKDSLVFTRCKPGLETVGLLSLTYLESIDADCVRVPIVSWKNDILI